LDLTYAAPFHFPDSLVENLREDSYNNEIMKARESPRSKKEFGNG